jgi:hypothetical protein
MIKVILLIFLTTISMSVQGQDSTLVREFCNSIGKVTDTRDMNAQVSKLAHMVEKYLEGNPMTGDYQHQDAIRFQYRLMRELMKSCPNYPVDRVRLSAQSVFDIENKLTKQQIDSLRIITSQIAWDKQVYVYFVTIDEFYPDSTITDFSNRYRDFWAPRTTPEHGVVLVVFSSSQRQVRISTGDISMTHLTDDECSEVNEVMISHFKKEKYFEGFVEGLLAIESRL